MNPVSSMLRSLKHRLIPHITALQLLLSDLEDARYHYWKTFEVARCWVNSPRHTCTCSYNLRHASRNDVTDLAMATDACFTMSRICLQFCTYTGLLGNALWTNTQTHIASEVKIYSLRYDISYATNIRQLGLSTPPRSTNVFFYQIHTRH